MLIRLSRIIPFLILGLVAIYFAAKHRSQQPIKLSIYDLPVMPLMNPKKVARVEDIYWRARISMQKKEVRNAYLCAYKIDQISDSSDYKQGRAYSHYLKGLVLYENKNYDSALYHHKRALLIQQDSIAQEDSWQMCYILSDLAKVYEKLGNQEQADICLLRRRDYMRGIWVRDFKELEEKKAKEKREKIHKEQEERDIIETLPRNLRLLYTKSELTTYKNVYQSLFYANEVIIKSLDQGSRNGFLLGNFRVSKLFSDMYLDIYHDVDKSIEWADRMIEQAKNLEYKDGEAIGLYKKAYIYDHYLKEYDNAIPHYFMAYKIYESLNVIEAVDQCLIGMASNYYQLQFFDKALSYYKLLIHSAQSIDNKADEAISYKDMALVYRELNEDPNKVILFYKKALVLHEELNNPIGMANCYNGIANAHYTLAHEYAKAKEYYLRAAAIFRTHNEKQELGQVYYNLGLTYKESNELDKALDYFKQTLAVGKEMGSSDLEISAQLQLGKLYVIQKNYSTAIKELTIAQQLAEQDKNTHLNLLIDITDTFSKLYEEMGDDSKAMDYVHKKEAWQNIAKAEREQITKLLEKQRFDTVKWEDTVEKKKEEGISMWWYIVSAVVISFVAGVKGAKIYTGIQNALSIIPRKKKNKRNISTQLTELKELVSYVLDKNQIHYSDQIKQEAQAIYAKMQEIEAHQHHISKRGISKRKLKELWDMLQNSKGLLALANQKKTNSIDQS